jgi:hypothetical protein
MQKSPMILTSYVGLAISDIVSVLFQAVDLTYRAHGFSS